MVYQPSSSLPGTQYSRIPDSNFFSQTPTSNRSGEAGHYMEVDMPTTEFDNSQREDRGHKRKRGGSTTNPPSHPSSASKILSNRCASASTPLLASTSSLSNSISKQPMNQHSLPPSRKRARREITPLIVEAKKETQAAQSVATAQLTQRNSQRPHPSILPPAVTSGPIIDSLKELMNSVDGWIFLQDGLLLIGELNKQINNHSLFQQVYNCFDSGRKLNSIYCKYYLGKMFLNSPNEEKRKEAVSLIHWASVEGCHKASNRLGKMYDKGIGGYRNPELAKQYYQHSMDNSLFIKNQTDLYKRVLREGHFKRKAREIKKRESLVRKYLKEKKYTLAMKELQTLPRTPLILCMLGKIYHYGWGQKINQQQAFYFFASALSKAEPKNPIIPELEYFVGKYYLYGLGGVPADQTRGIRLLESAVNKNYAAACYLLGFFYDEKDINKAIDYYEKGVNLNDNRCLYALAEILSGIEKRACTDIYKSLFYCDTLLKKKNVTLKCLKDALGLKGDLLDRLSVELRNPSSDVRGIDYLVKSAQPPKRRPASLIFPLYTTTTPPIEDGSLESLAQKHLAEGRYEEAIKVLENLSESPLALCMLGKLYFTGLGCQEDKDKAFRLFEKAWVRTNNPHIIRELEFYVGQYHLIAFVNGFGDRLEVIHWITSAAKRGLVEACYTAGNFYEKQEIDEKPDADYYQKGVELKGGDELAYKLARKLGLESTEKGERLISSLFDSLTLCDLLIRNKKFLCAVLTLKGQILQRLSQCLQENPSLKSKIMEYLEGCYPK